MKFGNTRTHTSAKMSKEDTERLQAILDGPAFGINLDYDLSTGKVMWGCTNCGATLLAFTAPCYNGFEFPGCKDKK